MFEFVRNNIPYIISFIDLCAASIVVPLLTGHLRSQNYSNVAIGLIGSVYSFIQFFSSPFVGHVSDKYGRKKTLLVSVLLCSISYLYLGMCQGLICTIIARSLVGTVKHTQLLCSTVISDQKLTSFGKLSGYSSMGFMIGPIIGGHLAHFQNGFLFCCLMCSILFLFNAVLINLFLNEPKIIHVSKPYGFRYSVKNIPWEKCWDVFLIKLLISISQISFIVNYANLIKEYFDTSYMFIGYTFSFQGIVGAFAAFTSPKLDKLLFDDDQNYRKCHIFTIFLSTTYLFFLLAINNIYVFLLLLIPFRICTSFLRIINNKMIMEKSTEHNRGLMMGTFSNVTSIGRFTVPVITGYLIDKFGFMSIIILSIITCTAAALFSRLRSIKEKVE